MMIIIQVPKAEDGHDKGGQMGQDLKGREDWIVPSKWGKCSRGFGRWEYHTKGEKLDTFFSALQSYN